MLQAMVTTSHVAIGALILAQSVVLSLRAARFFRSPAVNGVAELARVWKDPEITRFWRIRLRKSAASKFGGWAT
jgi:hypothetical protein